MIISYIFIGFTLSCIEIKFKFYFIIGWLTQIKLGGVLDTV